MRVQADTAMCVASGQCALLVPEVFDQRDDDGCVVVRVERPAPDQAAAVRNAVLTCPSGALRLIDS